MKSIEERAKEAGIICQYKSDYRYDKKSVEYGYIQGATEQKVIDIEKACEWITEHIDILYEGEFIDNSPVASDYIEWCKKRLEYAKEITDEFRKAMEEKL